MRNKPPLYPSRTPSRALAPTVRRVGRSAAPLGGYRASAGCRRVKKGGWFWAGLLLMTLMTAGSAWAQPAGSPPPQPAAQPVSGWEVKVEDRARAPVGTETVEPLVFGSWTFGGHGRWTDERGLPWDTDRAVRSSGLTPSLAALGPSVGVRTAGLSTRPRRLGVVS